MSILTEAHFHNEEAAYKRLESIVWPNGPVCPHCGNTDPDRVYRIKGKTARVGLLTCAECRKQFTVKVGTVFESSHVPLHKWFQAAHLLASSKKGFSAHQLHRTLKVTYKTAWFMAHRLREAMRDGDLAPLGGFGKIVEADETYFGSKDVIKKRTIRGKAAHSSKRSVVSLVERGSKVRSFHVDRADQITVTQIVRENVSKETRLHTDESRLYARALDYVDNHETVLHSGGEYVRGDVHTNTVEGYFSIFKRGMKGVYQHCGERHLHRYLAEFDFRYNNRIARGVNDDARTHKAIEGIVGKRLKYRDSLPASNGDIGCQ
jgi:transposase-like protein